MKFAIYKEKPKTEVSYSGQRGTCSGCGGKVIGKIYKNKINHWAHLNKECDKWYEPMSEWHMEWQNFFPIKNQEVTLTGEKGIMHRADVLLNNGVVIEIQYSPIKISEVEEREEFYGNNGLIWVLNAKKLIPKSNFYNFIYPKEITVHLDFNTEEISSFQEKEIISFLREKFRNRAIYIFQKSHHTFKFNRIQHIEYIQSDFTLAINDFRWKNCRYIREDVYKKWIKITAEITSNEFGLIKTLSRRQWRKFIDQMNFPVFLDDIEGLDEDYLYWLQKDRVVKKNDFLDKYLKYT